MGATADEGSLVHIHARSRSVKDVTKSVPWAPLSRRNAGLPMDQTLYEGVPKHLQVPLEAWCERFEADLPRSLEEGEEPSQRAATKWRLDLLLRLRLHEVSFMDRTEEEQLDLLDAMLRWSPEDDLRMRRHADALDELLTLGGSAWRVSDAQDGLERRIDRTVTKAAKTAIQVKSNEASQHLAVAWAAAYGRRPDPDKVFQEAIRAVEAVACPRVQPAHAANGKATLGTVIGELKNSSHRWQLALPGPDGGPGDVTLLTTMLTALWQAQVSRHAGAPKSRRQKQSEAEAAVHLAATLVQWLGTGVLDRKTP